MRQVKRWRYFCDHCNKSGGSGFHMKKHECGCTSNPNRSCGICNAAELSQRELPELVAAYKEKGIEKLRELTENCPACILTTLKVCYSPEKDLEQWEDTFNFKTELEAFWKEINEENERVYY